MLVFMSLPSELATGTVKTWLKSHQPRDRVPYGRAVRCSAVIVATGNACHLANYRPFCKAGSYEPKKGRRCPWPLIADAGMACVEGDLVGFWHVMRTVQYVSLSEHSLV